MKKLLFLSVLCLISLTMSAQRCAVLDFQIGTGVTEEEIDGLTYNFRSNFRVDGYTMLERIRINRTIETLGFSRTDMTMQQTLKVGRELETKLVVVGTMNKFMDEYSVDLRAIDVATGVTCATEGATFDKSNYRTRMEGLAARLGEKLAKGGSTNSVASSSSSPLQRNVPQGYVDLGLPSGTLWKAANESGLYDYNSAVSKFGDKLPTQEQLAELMAYCKWTWTGNGYKVVSDNGKFIILPASGYRNCDGNVGLLGTYGYYRSSTPNASDKAWTLGFNSNEVGMSGGNGRCNGLSVRLVQNP